MPEASIVTQNGSTWVRAPPRAAKRAKGIKFYYSTDGGYTYSTAGLRRRVDQIWEAKTTIDISSAIYCVEVEYPGPLFTSLFMSTIPTIPEGPTLRLRPYPWS